MATHAKSRSRATVRKKVRSPRRDPASGRIDPFAQRRDRYAPVLAALGLSDAFATMPRRFQEIVWQRKLPDPIVRLDSSVPPAAPARRTLTREIKNGMHSATFEAEGQTFLARDYYTIVPALMMTARATRLDGKLPGSVEAFIRLTLERAPAFFEAHKMPAARAVHDVVQPSIAAHSRHDVWIYTAEFTADRVDRGKCQPVLLIRAHVAEVRRARLDGVDRPVYRVAGLYGYDSPEWLSVPADALPPRGRALRPCATPPSSLPVYVQSHALRQLRRRLNHGPAVPYLEAWLADSLREPVGVERMKDNWLVPYVLMERRLGYLVVAPLPDMLVVRTFLFLTMDHTPEARALQRELKLCRRDVDWLGLADLASFTQTDLRHDPDLRRLFSRCGCDHLFNLHELTYAPAPRPFAAEVKRYLGLAA